MVKDVERNSYPKISIRKARIRVYLRNLIIAGLGDITFMSWTCCQRQRGTTMARMFHPLWVTVGHGR